MKKTILLGIIFICLGALVGNFFYENGSNNITNVFSDGNTYYFLQEGVYSSKEIMEENIKNIDQKAVEFSDDKYYVYLGITRNKENAQKIKDIYDKQGYQLYTKEVNLSDEEFYNNVVQFDMLIENTTDEEEILTIEEVVLANYEEIIKNDK